MGDPFIIIIIIINSIIHQDWFFDFLKTKIMGLKNYHDISSWNLDFWFGNFFSLFLILKELWCFMYPQFISCHYPRPKLLTNTIRRQNSSQQMMWGSTHISPTFFPLGEKGKGVGGFQTLNFGVPKCSLCDYLSVGSVSTLTKWIIIFF